MSDTTTAELFYFSPPADGSKPFTHIDADPLTGERSKNWKSVPHQIPVENVRGQEGNYTLDIAGFQFGKEAATHTSFQDDEAIKAEYYIESIDLVKRLTGASRAVVFDHSKCFLVASTRCIDLIS